MAEQKQLLDACDEANAAFRDGRVFTAKRRDLERWLVALCDVKPEADVIQKWNLRRADALKHLLHVRVTERLHRRTLVVSILALVVATISLVRSFQKPVEVRHLEAVRPAVSNSQIPAEK